MDFRLSYRAFASVFRESGNRAPISSTRPSATTTTNGCESVAYSCRTYRSTSSAGSRSSAWETSIAMVCAKRSGGWFGTVEPARVIIQTKRKPCTMRSSARQAMKATAMRQ